VAETPIRLYAAEQRVEGERWSDSAVRHAREQVARALRPISDRRGSAEYRLAMAQSLVEKFAYEIEGAAA
jgi:xanthine dehydrogenase small subunit